MELNRLSNGLLRKPFQYVPTISLIVLLILALVGFTNLGSFFLGFQITGKTSTSVHNLEGELAKISELATVKYYYKDVLEYKNNLKFKEINIPLTDKKYLVVYGGYIKAGVDLADARIEVIDRNNISLTLGRAKILDNVIDETLTSVYDEKDGLFNRITIADYNDVQIENKARLEKEFIAGGLLKDAEDNAKELLTGFLANYGFENIFISFK